MELFIIYFTVPTTYMKKTRLDNIKSVVPNILDQVTLLLIISFSLVIPLSLTIQIQLF